MRRHIFFTIIATLIFLLSISLNMLIGVKNFNYTEVKSTAEYLSSPNFKGRLTGTSENRAAASYIKSWFANNNIKPYNTSYYEHFEVTYPKKIAKEPYLRIISKSGDIIHEYKYGTDYKEDMINFKKNYVQFNKLTSREINNNMIQITEDNNSFIFYLTDDKELNFRSSFFFDSPVNMCVFISNSTFNEIKKYLSEDFSVECYIPFESAKTTVENVVGVIEGKDKYAPPVILSAHFDHLGADLSGNIYSGALDNASGTAFMLQMAKYIESLGKPERNVIFIGFNAEEFGCLGSKYFVENNKSRLLGSKVFNFDMIGSDYGVPLCIMGAETDTANTDLIKSVAAVCSDERVYFNYLFKDSSDHEYFRKNGIDAITFCDNDMSKIHTLLDTPNYLSTTAIIRCFNVVSKEVLKYAYDNNIFLLYTKEIFLYSFLCLSGILFICVIYREFRKS